MARPLVGILAGETEFQRSPGAPIAFHRASYAAALEHAGAATAYIPIPRNPTRELAERYCDTYQALCLTGGNHVRPRAEDVRGVDDGYPRRDDWELMLVDSAIEHGLSIIGICRGLQLLVYLTGGRLFQITGTSRPSHMKGEDARSRWLEIHHEMQPSANSFVAGVVENERLLVNTLHDQGASELGDNDLGLKVVARAEDGVIEVVERVRGRQLIVAAQAHIEALAYERIINPNAPPSKTTTAAQQWLRVFEAFVRHL